MPCRAGSGHPAPRKDRQPLCGRRRGAGQASARLGRQDPLHAGSQTSHRHRLLLQRSPRSRRRPRNLAGQDNIRKTPQTVDDLVGEAASTDERRYYRLSILGILGNRGVRAGKGLPDALPLRARPSGSTRAAAINGLGLLGTKTPSPFFSRSSAAIRLRPARARRLQSGRFRHAVPRLRQHAVPEPIRFLQESQSGPDHAQVGIASPPRNRAGESPGRSRRPAQRRYWPMRPAAQPAQVDHHRHQQPQQMTPDVGMPLLISQAYTIVVSGRKMKPSTGSTKPPWKACCR